MKATLFGRIAAACLAIALALALPIGAMAAPAASSSTVAPEISWPDGSARITSPGFTIDRLGNAVPIATGSAAINVSTATTTQLVALSGTTSIYVTSFDFVAAGTGNVTLVYGTGSSCGTGTTSLTGPYNLTAQAGVAKGNGMGAVLFVPSGKALCVTTSAAVQVSGSISYVQY